MSGRKLTQVLLAVLSLAFAQDRAPAGRGAPGQPPGQTLQTLTRSASKYQALELKLIEALEDRSDAHLAEILADDFEVWSAEQSGPTSRQDWQKSASAGRAQPSRLRELTVREFGDVAVVSFLLQGDPGGRGAAPALFIVDIWSQQSSRLEVRYLSTPAKPAPADGRRK